MKHYLMLQLSVGKSDFERQYFPLLSAGETAENATERWLDSQIAHRKRNLAKARQQARNRIEYVRIVRPTSWYREQELGSWAPKSEGRVRRGR